MKEENSTLALSCVYEGFLVFNSVCSGFIQLLLVIDTHLDEVWTTSGQAQRRWLTESQTVRGRRAVLRHWLSYPSPQ